uniref:Uncharacterized protein n=1 Tax=Solanum tuberosum TaxID=4113 RepID=M1ANK1_SOLTU
MSKVPRVQTPLKQLHPVVDAVKDEVVEIEENEKVVQRDRNEEVGLERGGRESSSRSRVIGKEVGERSTTDVEFRSEVQHNIPSTFEFVKTFSIDKFQVKMPIDDDTDFGDCVVQSVMGKVFDQFRVILKEQKLETFFRSSCFGLYLDLPENNNVHFQMTMVYGLLKRRILVSHVVEPLPIVRPKKTTNKPKKVKGKEKVTDDVDLVDIVGKGYRSTDLLKDLESKKLSSKHKESLCLVWFVHAILWAKNANQVIPASLLKLSQNREEFNNYPWNWMERRDEVMSLKLSEVLGDGEEAVGDPVGVVGDVGSGFDGSGGGDELDDVAHHSVFEKGIDHDVASPSLCSTCQCKGCNERHAELVNRIHALITEAVNNLVSNMGTNPSKRISNSYIPIEIRKRKRAISKALSSIKVIRKVVNPLPHNVRPAVQLELQKVSIYKRVDPPKNKKLENKIPKHFFEELLERKKEALH